MEGFLPSPWWLIWSLAAIPFLLLGLARLRILVRDRRETLPLIALSGAFIFVLSSLKMPTLVIGSSSHPTGTGLSSILFGPSITCVLSCIVLIYQAFFLAHGGFTTLGANLIALGVAGPGAGYLIYKGGCRAGLPLTATVCAAAAMADITTYLVTALQLALAFPAASGGFLTSWIAFTAIFAVTQVPLAIIEGALTALVFRYIMDLRPDILVSLGVVTREMVAQHREGADEV